MKYNNKLLEDALENENLENAVHLLHECIIRMELVLKFNNINNIDRQYTERTIDPIKKFLGEEEL